MDMYQKRKMRQEKKNNDNQEEKLTKVGINCDVGINGNHLKSVEKSTFIQRISLHF